MTPKTEAYIADAPGKYQGVMRRAFEGKASPRQAIKAMCYACTGYDLAAVTDCSAQLCPLHPYRP